jgi:hypothetical protein
LTLPGRRRDTGGLPNREREAGGLCSTALNRMVWR